MRHRVHARKLGRSPSHRLAMYRNLVTSLLEHEQIRTTDAKAKELRGVAERMITLGKKGTLHARRNALKTIRSKEVTSKVFDELADDFLLQMEEEEVDASWVRIDEELHRRFAWVTQFETDLSKVEDERREMVDTELTKLLAAA